MYDEGGEPTLYEFDAKIDRVKSVAVDLNVSPAASPVHVSSPVPHEPVSTFLHVHEALRSFSPASSPSPHPSSPSPDAPTPDLPSSQPASPPRPHPRTGRVLSAADFRPVRALGKGGHGTVYLVEDTMSERPFALKVVEKNGLRLREYPPVFEEQAVMRALTTAAAGVEGGAGTGAPCFVPLVGSFEDSDNFYFLTEYFPRGDLTIEMKRNGIVPQHQARLWCAELLVALDHLHKQRIVHRDIKLDNILLDENNHVVLTDFGIARAFGRTDADRPWTYLSPWNAHNIGDHEEHEREDGKRMWSKGPEVDETQSLMGTPGYVAPEVYSGKYSHGVDVWGAGVVLHCMLTGRLPFGLQPREQRLEEIIARTDNLPADLDLVGVDEDARDLLMKMLEKDPKKRPPIRKLKKHRWFRGIKWDAIEHREPRRQAYRLDAEVSAEQECFYIPFGSQYAPDEAVPHEWFEWTSPSLQRGEPTYDTTTDSSLGSTCYIDPSVCGEVLHPNGPATLPSVRKWPTMLQKMKGWLKKRRMSVP